MQPDIFYLPNRCLDEPQSVTFDGSRPSLDEIVNEACRCAEPVDLEIEAVLRIVSQVMMQDRHFRA